MAPKSTGAGVEGGETMVTAEAAVVVVNLEEDPAAADVPEAGQGAVAASPPAMAEPEAERTPPAAEGELVAGRPEAGAREAGEKRKESECSPRQPTPCPTCPRGEGPQEKAARPGPRLRTMGDAGQAASLLASVPTPETVEEVRGLSPAIILDMLMVSMVQMVNGVMGLREVVVRSSNALGRAVDRANRYKKDSEVRSQSLARLHAESKAREEDFKNQIKDAERRAKEAASRASSLEARLDVVSIRLKTAQTRAEEQDHHLQQAWEQAAAAQDEARAAVERAAAAEKAAVEASLEKAGAVACANKASARAVEAEARAKEAEAKAQQAEAGADKAVENYKSSPEFKKEVIEASLDAYVKGFDSCKARVSEAFKIDGSELERIQPEESEEEQAEEEGGEEVDMNRP